MFQHTLSFLKFFFLYNELEIYHISLGGHWFIANGQRISNKFHRYNLFTLNFMFLFHTQKTIFKHFQNRKQNRHLFMIISICVEMLLSIAQSFNLFTSRINLKNIRRRNSMNQCCCCH